MTPNQTLHSAHKCLLSTQVLGTVLGPSVGGGHCPTLFAAERIEVAVVVKTASPIDSLQRNSLIGGYYLLYQKLPAN